MNTPYKTTRHAKFLINYHFVWIPKYRKGILDNTAVSDLIKNIIYDIAEKFEFDIMAVEVMKDHIHLSISALPRYSPAELINIIKGNLGYKIAIEFPELKQKGKIWTNAYFCVTTGDVSTETIKQYIENQWSKIG